MAVYLLHLDPPLRHCRHYIGYARTGTNLDERLIRHQKGTGGVLPREAGKQGSIISLVYVWLTAGKEFERRLKRNGGAVRWCPVCAVNKRRLPQPKDGELD